MHKRYRAVSAVLAAAILVAGSTMSVSAKGFFYQTEEDTVLTYEIEDSLLSASLSAVIEGEEEISEEELEEIQEEQLNEEIEEELGAPVEEIGVAAADDYVNIRDSASKSGEIVGRLYAGSVAIVTGSEDGWYEIESGSVTGYVKAKYLSVGDADEIDAAEKTIATVTADSLRVRSEASKDGEVITSATEDSELEVLSTDNEDWVEVTTSAGDGYVSAEYVELSTGYQTALTIEEVEELEEEQAVSTGSAVVAYAAQFLGNPYVYGGSSLTNGTDCSGFVMSVYAHFGISLPHSSYALRSVGVAVDRADIQPGDIVCYNGHVGIYAGNNTLIHASNERDGIKYTYGIDYRTIVAIRRVL